MAVVDTIKELVSLIQKLDNIDLQRRILAVQAEALDLIEQNGKLRQRVSELEELIAKRAEVRSENGVYYRNLEDGSREGPICSRCWNVTDKQVMLQSRFPITRPLTPGMRSRCPRASKRTPGLSITP